MSDGNGGIIGPDNDPTTSTQSAVITTFNSTGTLTTAAHTKELQYLIIAGGGAGVGRGSIRPQRQSSEGEAREDGQPLYEYRLFWLLW